MCMYFFCNSSSAACAKFHNFCERLVPPVPVLVWCLPVTCHSYRAINKPNLRFPPYSAHSVGMEHRLLSRQSRSRSQSRSLPVPAPVASIRFIFMGLPCAFLHWGYFFAELGSTLALVHWKYFLMRKMLDKRSRHRRWRIQIGVGIGNSSAPAKVINFPVRKITSSTSS